MIGISPQQQENGTTLFVPLTTMHALLTSRPADATHLRPGDALRYA